ncbi:hypothetical protein RAS1_29000 [Phycisphaerae bacterium RAS1]|nr:hypothetical protein RAS1_29000 [Phycisphaerae bacterium RAS1]
MSDPLAGLEKFGLRELLAMDPALDRTPPAAGYKPRTKIPLDGDRRIDRPHRVDRMLDARRIAAASAILTPLPEPGTAAHIVVSGTFRPWDCVPAMIAIVAPAKVDELLLTTLSLNQAVADELLALLDLGAIGRAMMICSEFWTATDGGIFEHLSKGMQARRQAIRSARVHTKLLGFALSDGRRYVFEMSGNLRSSHNLEQIAIVADADLYEFHRRWIAEVIERGTANDGRPTD